jgi:putative nucleotidyltransferase with HDIG domain
VQSISSSLQKLFSLPIHDKDQALKGRYLILLAWAAIAVVLGYGLLTVLFFRENLARLSLAFAVLPLALGIYLLVRRKKVRLAGWVFTLSLWSILALSAYSGGGIRSPGFVSQMMIVLIAGILISWRVSVFFAVLSSLFGFGLMTFQVSGLLPINPISPLTDWATSSVLFIEVALVLFLSTRSIRKALDQARLELKVRHQVEQELRSSQTVLAVAQEIAQVGNWEWEPQRDLMRWSTKTAEIFGLDPETSEPGIDPLKDRVHPGDLGAFEDLFELAMDRDEAQSLEFSIIRSDDTLRIVKQVIQRHVSEDRPRLIGTVQDITTTKLAQEERERLLNAEREQRKMAESSSRIGIALSESADMSGLMRLICVESMNLFRAHSSFVWLREGDELVGIAGLGRLDELVGRRLPLDDALTFGPRVVRSNQTLFVNDAYNAEDVNAQLIQRFEIRSLLGVPLSRGDHAVGALILVDHEDIARFSEKDKERASIFGNYLAVAIEKAQLFSETERQAESLRALFETAMLTSSVLDTSELLDLIHNQIHKLFEPDTFTVVKLLPARTSIQVLRTVESGISLSNWNQQQSPREDDTLLNWVLSTERSRLEKDLHLLPEVRALVQTQRRTRSWLGVPLMVHGDLIGAMAVQSFEPEIFNDYHQKLMESMAAQIAVALENARLYEETSQNAAETEALVRISSAFRNAETQQEALRILAHDSHKLVEADYALISLVGAAAGDSELAFGIGADRERPEIKAIWKAAHDRVVQTGRLESFEALTEKGNGKLILPPGVDGVMGLPLQVQNHKLGVFLLWRSDPFSESDLQLIRTITDIAASTLRRTTLRTELEISVLDLKKRNQDLNRLYKSSMALLVQPGDSEESLQQKIVDTVREEFGVAICRLFLIEESNGSFREAAHSGRLIADEGEGPPIAQSTLRIERSIANRATVQFSHPAAADVADTSNTARTSHLIVPLRAGERPLGALEVIRETCQSFDAEDERALALLGERAALTLENARLYTQTESRLNQLDTLRNIDLAISASMDLSITMTILIDQLLRQLGVDAAAVHLLDPFTQQIDFQQGRGFRSNAIESTPLRLGQGHAGAAALERRSIFEIDLAAAERPLARPGLVVNEGFVSYLGTPLIAKGEVKGVLEVFHRSELAPDAEWRSFLEAMAGQAAIAIENATLFENLQRSNTELVLAYDTTIEAWARILDLRDRETEGHSRRVAEVTVALARRLGIADIDLVHIRRGALLHDIGKMAIPDSILLKKGKLSANEWQIMQQHPIHAYEMLAPIQFLRPALEIPYCHHERWDGGGYPRNLEAEQIPLSARIFALVDVWDALRSNRPYRAAWSSEDTAAYIQDQIGRHFDPELAQVFLEHIRERDGQLDGQPK